MKSREDTKQALVPKKAREAVRRAAGGATGALIGLGIGGPPGAVAGAIAGPVVAALVEVAEEAARRRFSRWSHTYASAIEIAGVEPQELASRLYADDDKLEVGFQALTAAAQTTVNEKSEALAAAVASVATSDAKHEIDAISLVVKALADIDRPHLMLLKLIADAKPHQATPDYLAQHSQTPIPVLRPIVRVLELHGLIADANRLTPGVAGVIWELTDMGQLCLRLLRHERANKECTQ